MSRAFEKKRGNFLILPEVERQREMTWGVETPTQLLSGWLAGTCAWVADGQEGWKGRRSFSALIALRRTVGNVKKNNNREKYTKGKWQMQHDWSMSASMSPATRGVNKPHPKESVQQCLINRQYCKSYCVFAFSTPVFPKEDSLRIVFKVNIRIVIIANLTQLNKRAFLCSYNS